MVASALIEIPSWGSMTLVEAIWLASGLIACLFTGMHIEPLYEDWLLARNTERPVLGAVAGGYLRRELIRFIQGVMLTTIGLYAAIEPPAIPGPAVVSLVGLVLTAVLLSISFLVSVQSVWDWRTRQQIQDLVAEGQNGHAVADIP